MNCSNCSKDMKLIYCNDTCTSSVEYKGNSYSIAYNIFECEECMTIAVNNVWDNPGTIFIEPDNTVSRVIDSHGI